MASTYPVIRSGWVDSLVRLFCIREEHETDATGQKTQAFRLFRQFLALKIAIPFAFSDGIHGPLNLKMIAVLMVIIAVLLPHFARAGLWVIVGFSLYDFWQSWPFTINHGVLEFGILLLMCLIPDDESPPYKISVTDMIKILMLSVWFYSGIHKLFDGYYWNAEFFALEVLSNQTPLGQGLHKILNLFGSFVAPTGPANFSCCTFGMFELTSWHVAILLGLSWLTIIAEIFLPLLLIIPKFRMLGIVGLFIFQAFIAYFSGEIDFAFTAFAILFLFIPRLARFTYPSLACLLLVVQPWL